MMRIEKIFIGWSATEIEKQTAIADKILDDFTNFKTKNELRFCALYQSNINEHKSVDTTWRITIRYNEHDLEKIKSDFKRFCAENTGENCHITKMTCQENTYVIEYSIYRTYTLHHN